MKEWHQSQRGFFAGSLYNQMQENEDIWLLSADLGYLMWNKHFEEFPDRCINTGASEQAMLGVGVGLAQEGKIPFCYSITPFLLWRPAEVIRNYINREELPVMLAGSGRDMDYSVDGYSHYAHDAVGLLARWPNIKTYWPQEKEEVPGIVSEMVSCNRPAFISLSR